MIQVLKKEFGNQWATEALAELLGKECDKISITGLVKAMFENDIELAEIIRLLVPHFGLARLALATVGLTNTPYAGRLTELDFFSEARKVRSASEIISVINDHHQTLSDIHSRDEMINRVFELRP